MSTQPYNTSAWRALADQAIARDGARCNVGRLLGGDCSTHLHVHHLVPISEGGDPLPGIDGVITVCNVHHPQLEALRRYVMRARQPPRCRHVHRYKQGRVECERRLAQFA